MSISQNFPTIRPSLLLDFVNTKRLDPRITFARASTARYYDGVTTAKAEENLLLQSGAMTVSPWGVSNSGTATSPTITADAGTSPDGTTTASRYVLQLNSGTSTSDISFIRQNYTTAAGQDYTLSVWVKSYDGTSTYTMQLVGAGAVQSISVTGTWQRFTVTGSSSSTQQGLRIRGGQSPTNDDSVDILVWGAQLEQRSAVTAYTATTTQPITNYVPVLLTAQNDVSRFQHDPVTGASDGLMLEEQRTNSFTYSEDFADAAWTKSASTITSNTIVAPDGTLTGDKLVEDATTATHFVRQSQSLTTGNKYTVSVYAKAAERTELRIQFGTAAGAFPALQTGDFNFSTVTATPSANGVASMTAVGNGWYRCVFTTDTATGTQSMNIQIMLRNGGVSSYAGNGYSGIYVWGAQLEAGEVATSYIPTTTTALTRSADAASMTGTNFSEWFNNAEGTIYFDGGIPNNYSTGFPVLYSINDTTANNNIQPAINAGGDVINVEMKVANSVVAGFYPAYTSGFTKLSFAYKFNDVNYAKDGNAGTTDTSAAIPAVTQLNIGANIFGGGTLNGYIRKIAYYPVRLSNAQLQALTA